GLASVMRDEGRKRGIKDGSATFPSEHHRLFVVIKTFPGHSPKILEGILMSSDQAIEVTVSRKVDVLTPGETQDIGETLDRALAATGERDRIGTPIHLALLPRIRLKPYHRFSLRDPQYLEPLSQNADPPSVARFFQLFVDPQTRDVGVLFQSLPVLRVEAVKLARPRVPFGQYIMTHVPSLG